MTDQTFLNEMKQYLDILKLPNNYMLIQKNWVIWNTKTNEEYKRGTFEKAKEFDLGGFTLAEYIQAADTSIFDSIYDNKQ